MKKIYFLKTIIIIMMLANVSCFDATCAAESAECYFEKIKSNPAALSAFLHAMPKGGDLHNHLGGASLSENLIRYGAKDHLCIDRGTYSVSVSKCSSEDLLENIGSDQGLYNLVIDAWSMRNFKEGKESGHDHFFATFGKYGAISKNHMGEMLAEVIERAGKQNELYLELMVTPDNNASGLLGKQIGWDPNLSALRQKLLDGGLKAIVATISKKLDAGEAEFHQILQCATEQPRVLAEDSSPSLRGAERRGNPDDRARLPRRSAPRNDGTVQPKLGCDVQVRYLYQVLREQPPVQVFSQLLAGFEAASQDTRIVGINMVQPEDGVISMRDYRLHMEMVSFLHELYPSVQITLHAGELNSVLVPAEGLKFHIRSAVEAGAKRIGHGVDIAGEDNADQLLKVMAEQQTLVEINLSSNEMILGVKGSDHPLPLYMRYHVPVALSTDDEGVIRTNLTEQYQKAVTTFQFDYPTLKNIDRNSLTYSFLPGKSLWVNNQYQAFVQECRQDNPKSSQLSPECKAFLNANEKARLQWELEKRFVVFEDRYRTH